MVRGSGNFCMKVKKSMMKREMKSSVTQKHKGTTMMKVAMKTVAVGSGIRSVAVAKGQTGTSVLPKPVAFPDHKEFPDFRPNLTPSQIFRMGSFMDQGGYWRPIYSGILKKKVSGMHKKFPKKWWAGIPEENLVGPGGKKANRYGVGCGLGLDDWEKGGWIVAQDPYGWVHWYCNFFNGRRSFDDGRQIKRWMGVAGAKGRFKNNLANQVRKARTAHDNEKVSPVIRQVLQHWGYQLTAADCK